MSDISEYRPDHRMRDLISDNSILLMMLSRFGISLGFGEKTVREICEEQNVDCHTFLSVANFTSFGLIRLDGISLESIMTYLKRAHSYFLDFCLPMIRRKIIEAIDCSGRDEIAMLILKFYDAYTEEVRRHMDYEDNTVFPYVEALSEGKLSEEYSISVFASGHHGINEKLKELKDIIIRYLPQRSNDLLNAVLFDIINCEQDLTTHCRVEDKLFTPTVESAERKILLNPQRQTDDNNNKNGDDDADDRLELLSQREREIIICVARGMSNKEIADLLCLSVHTVTTHRRNISQKLQIHSPAGLTIYAVVNGLLNMDDLRQA